MSDTIQHHTGEITDEFTVGPVSKNFDDPKPNNCPHDSLKFLYPGQGRYDIYKCLKCGESTTKRWENG